MIVSEPQHELKVWLCDRIGLVATPHLCCIGSVIGGVLKGVVGFDNYNGSSVMMHSAGDAGWLTREMLHAAFHYPFEACKVNMIIGLVPSGNAQAIRFNTHIGFKTELTLDGAHPDGALVLMTMRRGECRYLPRNRNGQEEQAAAST